MESVTVHIGRSYIVPKVIAHCSCIHCKTEISLQTVVHLACILISDSITRKSSRISILAQMVSNGPFWTCDLCGDTVLQRNGCINLCNRVPSDHKTETLELHEAQCKQPR